MDATTDEDTQKKLQDLLARVAAGHPLSYAESELLKSRSTDSKYATLKDVAAFFGITQGALRRWEEKYPDAFEKGSNGYNIEKIKAARQQFLASGKYARLNDGDTINVEGVQDVASLKARKIHLECQKLATQIEILQSKYVSVDEVLAQVRAVMYAIKEKIKRIPPEMAYEVSGVSPAEAEERLLVCIDKILREMEHEDYIKIEEQLKSKKVDVEMMEVEIAPTEPVKRGRPRKS
jgi:IS4 transposase